MVVAAEVEMAFKGRVCRGEGPCSWAPMMGWNIEIRILGVCLLFFGWRFLDDGRIVVTCTGMHSGGAAGGARGRARLAGIRLGSACCCSGGGFGGLGVVSSGMLLVCGGKGGGWV